ncbi:MAG: amino acid adenylation domain protein, partial [Candidatus Angelobacter sp.]|nr:amino acid adenylation domain protein [Candidatus Angelobacter sp.]
MNKMPTAFQNQDSAQPSGSPSVELMQVERLVSEVCAEALNARQVNLRDNLLELGMDSIGAMQIVSRLNQHLAVDIGIRELVEAGTIENIVEIVRRQRHCESILIGSIPRPPLLPLSYAQERVWFLAQLGYSEHYHVLRTFQITCTLDLAALTNAIQYLVGRHEILRTVFREVEGKPFQYVEQSSVIELRECNLCGHDLRLRNRELETAIRELCEEPFILTQAPLMRAALIRLDEQSYILGLCLHHIISDGWSMGLLAEELSAAYSAYSEIKPPVLASLPVEYADYVLWQHKILTEQRLEKELAYWREQLSGYQELELPTDCSRPVQISGRGGHVRMRMEGDKVRELVQFCQKQQITFFTLFLSSVYVLLKRYSGQSDICIGVPVANRHPWQVRDVVGLFVNTLVVRISAPPMSCEQLMKKVQAQILEAQDHQAVPFEKVVETIQPKRDLARNPIFQVLANHVTAGREEMRFGKGRIKSVDFDQDTAKLDLSFTLSEDPDGTMGVTVEYSGDIYERGTIERMSGHLLGAVRGLVEGGEEEIDELELMREEERRQILEEWNGTEFEYEKRCLHEWVEEEARRSGEKVAVRWRGGKLSYRELEERSRRVGLYLQRGGVGPESLVGLCMGRSGWRVVGMLGILRAGGGYVPVDAGYPKERVRYMLKESGVRMVVTERGMREKVREMV